MSLQFLYVAIKNTVEKRLSKKRNGGTNNEFNFQNNSMFFSTSAKANTARK